MPAHTPNTGGPWCLACCHHSQRDTERWLHPVGPKQVLGPIVSAYFNKELFTVLPHACPLCWPGAGVGFRLMPRPCSDAALSGPLAQAGGWPAMTPGQTVLGTLTQPLNMLSAWHTRTTLGTLCVQQVPVQACQMPRSHCLPVLVTFTGLPCTHPCLGHAKCKFTRQVQIHAWCALVFRCVSTLVIWQWLSACSSAGSAPSVRHTLPHAGYRMLSTRQPYGHTCQPEWLHAKGLAHAKLVGHMLHTQQWQVTR